MKIFQYIKDASLLAAGAPPEIVKYASPADQLRLHIVGASVLIPASLAYFGGAYAFQTFFPSATWSAWLLAGPFFFLVILGLEIVLNASLSPARNLADKMRLARWRIFLSLMLSLTIALPLKLAIFSGPIQQELFQMHREALDEVRSTSEEQLDVLIAQVGSMQSRLDEKQATCDGFARSYVAEMDGNGAGIAGLGPFAKRKKQLFDICKQEQAVFAADLKILQNKLAGREIVMMAEVRKRGQETEALKSSDLMSQLHALSRLVAESLFLKFAGLVLFLLLAGIDLIPTLVKVHVKVDSYRMAEEQAEHRVKAQLEAQLLAEPHIAQSRAEELLADELDRQLLKTRLRKSKTRAALMDLEFKERSLLDQKIARNSIYEDADFMEVLKKYDQQLFDLNGGGDLSGNKDYDEEDDGPVTPSSSGDTINIVRTKREGFERRRAPQRPPQKHYYKKEVI